MLEQDPFVARLENPFSCELFGQEWAIPMSDESTLNSLQISTSSTHINLKHASQTSTDSQTHPDITWPTPAVLPVVQRFQPVVHFWGPQLLHL